MSDHQDNGSQGSNATASWNHLITLVNIRTHIQFVMYVISSFH